MNRTARRSWVVSLVLLACGPGPTASGEDVVAPTGNTPSATDAANPAVPGTARTLYTTILGRSMGTMAVERLVLPGGGERWTTTTLITLALDDPGENASTTTIVDVSEYGPDLRLRSSDETSTEAGIVERVEIRIDGNELSIETKGPSHTTSKTLELPADYGNDRHVYDRLQREVEAGATLPHGATYSTFDDERLMFEPTTLTLVARSSAEIEGKTVATWKVELINDEGEHTIAELDDFGIPLSMKMGAFASSMTPPGDAPDVVLSSYLDIEGYVPRDATSLQVVVSIADEDPDEPPVFHGGPYHTVDRRNGEYRLDLKAMRGDTTRTAKYPLAVIPDDIEPFLEPTTTSQSDHKAIVHRARALVDGAADARTAAQGITRWVHANLGKRDGTRGAATAVEALEAGFGDCTEHAALTVALLRAAGLPARNVSGVVLVPGLFSADAGYHAWAEVWIGEWIALDAALGQTEVAAHYLFLGYDEPGLASGGGRLSRMLGRTKIRVPPRVPIR